MSGCQPTETMQLCIHNVPIKFGCDKCAREHLQNQINSVEHLVKHSQEGIEKCFERIEKLEEGIIQIQRSLETFMKLNNILQPSNFFKPQLLNINSNLQNTLFANWKDYHIFNQFQYLHWISNK